jgi:hypothetical protein
LGILGILGIENRKPKIENWKLKIEKNLSLSKPATTTQKIIIIINKNKFIYFIFLRPRGRARVRADAPCFTPRNFKKEATVRLSHGRPRGHCPIVHPSVHPSVWKRPHDNHACGAATQTSDLQSFHKLYTASRFDCPLAVFDFKSRL